MGRPAGSCSSVARGGQSTSIARDQGTLSITDPHFGTRPSEYPLTPSHLSASRGPADEGFWGQNQSQDLPLDAFDKALLVAEPVEDRSWQAPQPLARISLPPKSLRTPSNSGEVWTQMKDELYATPRLKNTSSSAPGENVYSPTVVAQSQRPDYCDSFRPSPTLELNHSSPLSRMATCAPSRPFQKRSHISASASKIPQTKATPMVQGISLISVNDMADRLRSLFSFPLFNAVQSKCFETSFNTDDNIVLSAPTGSGKTVVMELAICRLMHSARSEEFKIVYQAPTKALCSERCVDWQTKFGSLDLRCAELTGDTDASQMRNVQAASIIITTPEKWDSITRRWKDHEKLMRLIKLFLIDEVHMLKEARGATLEAVVSRMRSTGSSVRFVALSATIPNSEDVATWLGRDSMHPNLPAYREVFGETFRPVQLQKVVYGYAAGSNNFIFDSVLESKLPEMIAKHSQRKPVMIFCPFRKSCAKTAKALAQLWMSTTPSDRLWDGPKLAPGILDNELRQTFSAGVAYHHAGLDVADRRAVEQAFLSHNVSIICCTSTLAVGVNLPCYLVIVKGTSTWTDTGSQEYTDLEMMQMLGRAGRPQFEQSACAVILTQNERTDFYKRLVAGQEPLESCLHLNLIDHLNAEIGLGTVADLLSAKRWLASTFLFVRLSRNPNHYRLKENVSGGQNEDLLEHISSKDVTLLQEADLVTRDLRLSCTEFGHAMARYYIKFETMKMLLALPPKSKLSEIISAIAQAAEFRNVRLKSGEKGLYKHINKEAGIKFPIKVDVALPAHKVSLLLQAELAGVEYPVDQQFCKHKVQFQQDKAAVFQHINRLVRCIIDCQIIRGDSVSARHALELARTFAARVWDNSPLQLKQLEQIGNVAVRRLANAGINTIESLENAEAHRIEAVLGRGPPFGMKLLCRVSQFPKLRVMVRMVDKEMRPHGTVQIRLKAEIGFINEAIPLFFRRRPIYVCFLAETFDGQVVDFRRIAAMKLRNGHEVLLSVEFTQPSQHVMCHVMCDEIAGTCRSAEWRPNVPASLFHSATEQQRSDRHGKVSKRCLNDNQSQIMDKKRKQSEGFDEDGLDDGDLLGAESIEVMDIDAFDEELGDPPSTEDQLAGKKTDQSKRQRAKKNRVECERLENGNWACNHKCKEKGKCRHRCCKLGLDKPPKPAKKSNPSTAGESYSVSSMLDVINKAPSDWSVSSPTKSPGAQKRASVERTWKQDQSPLDAKKAKSLKRLHQVTTPSVQISTSKSQSASSQNEYGVQQPSQATETYHDDGMFDSDWATGIGFEDPEILSQPQDTFRGLQAPVEVAEEANKLNSENTIFGLEEVDFDFDENDATMLEASMIGLEDSVNLQNETMTGQSNNADKHCQTMAIRKSCASKDEPPPADDAFDDDDGIFDIEQGGVDAPNPAPPRSPHCDEDEYNQKRLSSSRTATRWSSSPKQLFFTSPQRQRQTPPRLPPVPFGAELPLHAKLHEVDSAPPTVAGHSPLQEITNQKQNMQIPSEKAQFGHPVASDDCDQNGKTIEKSKKNNEEQQRQRLLMEGIDPAFYDEFRDIVEFI